MTEFRKNGGSKLNFICDAWGIESLNNQSRRGWVKELLSTLGVQSTRELEIRRQERKELLCNLGLAFEGFNYQLHKVLITLANL